MLDRPLAKLRKEKRKEIFIKLIYKEKYHNRYQSIPRKSTFQKLKKNLEKKDNFLKKNLIK